MRTVTLSSKRQITISKDDLSHVGAKTGQKLAVHRWKGALLIKPVQSSVVEATAGSLAPYVSADKRGVPWATIMEETQKIVAEKLAKKHATKAA